MAPRALNAFGRCPDCGIDYSTNVGTYHCLAGCEESSLPPLRTLSCGCCTHGCTCWSHQDRRIGRPPFVCDTHIAMGSTLHASGPPHVPITGGDDHSTPLLIGQDTQPDPWLAKMVTDVAALLEQHGDYFFDGGSNGKA